MVREIIIIIFAFLMLTISNSTQKMVNKSEKNDVNLWTELAKIAKTEKERELIKAMVEIGPEAEKFVAKICSSPKSRQDNEMVFYKK